MEETKPLPCPVCGYNTLAFGGADIREDDPEKVVAQFQGAEDQCFRCGTTVRVSCHVRVVMEVV